MTEATLRTIIIEKQRGQCKGEPGPHAIANWLSAVGSRSFVDNLEADIEQLILGQIGYESIDAFREDAEALMESLKQELGVEAWNKYFGNG